MILALETSTRRATLAVYDPVLRTVAAETAFVTDRAHNAAIFAPLGEMVETYRDALSGIVVGLGPGSYGGVRVAIAAANGLGLSLGLPVFGGNSLESWETDADSYLVVGDARRGSFFLAEVRDRRLVADPELVPCDSILDRIRPFVASGRKVHSADRKVIEAIPEAVVSHPSASLLASLCCPPAPDSLHVRPVEPIYLRPPYITTPKP